MIGKIIELRESRLPKEGWMDEIDFYDVDNKFFDWVETSKEREKDLASLKATLPTSMFRMEEDEIEIISDGKEVVENWIAQNREMTDNLSYKSVMTFPTLLMLKNKLKSMIDLDYKFITDYADYTQDSTAFVQDCISNYQGKKLYVCGIINYHY